LDQKSDSDRFDLGGTSKWTLHAWLSKGKLKRSLPRKPEGGPRRRVLLINPEKGADHIHPIELRDAKFLKVPSTDVEMQQLAQFVVTHVTSQKEKILKPWPIHPAFEPVGQTVVRILAIGGFRWPEANPIL